MIIAISNNSYWFGQVLAEGGRRPEAGPADAPDSSSLYIYIYIHIHIYMYIYIYIYTFIHHFLGALMTLVLIVVITQAVTTTTRTIQHITVILLIVIVIIGPADAADDVPHELRVAGDEGGNTCHNPDFLGFSQQHTCF